MILGLLPTKAKRPEEGIGPDGMTDFAREEKRKRDIGHAARAKLEEAIAGKVGLPIEAFPYVPYELLLAALLIDVRLDG